MLEQITSNGPLIINVFGPIKIAPLNEGCGRIIVCNAKGKHSLDVPSNHFFG